MIAGRGEGKKWLQGAILKNLRGAISSREKHWGFPGWTERKNRDREVGGVFPIDVCRRVYRTMIMGNWEFRGGEKVQAPFWKS